MAEGRRVTTGKLVVAMGAFVLVGVPMFAYLWWTLNELISGFINPSRLGISAVVLIFFIGLLVLLSRTIQRWEAMRESEVSAQHKKRR